MKCFIFLLFFFVEECYCISDPSIRCDSIRIVGFKEYEVSPFTIGRSIFFDAVKHDPKGTIDTTIVDQNKIKSIIICLKNLQIESKLNVDTYHIDYKYNDNGTQIEQNSLNNQMCLMLHNGNETEIIWVGRFFLDRKTNRYRINNSLMETLSEFTNVFDGRAE